MSCRAVAASWKRLLGGSTAARSSHTVTSLAGSVCVFGGEDSPRNAFDPYPHLLQLDHTWKTGISALPGLPRLGHNAASIGSKLHVFGGRLGGPNTFSGKDSGESGEFFTYDKASNSWAQLDAADVWPEPRSFHAMCSGDKEGAESVFVFGGCGASGRLNDLWKFDPNLSKWTCLHPGGSDAPKARGGSSLVATADGSSLCLLFGFSGAQQGDISYFDLNSQKWRILEHSDQKGDVPSPRSVFASARCPNSNEVVLFGGERVESDKGHAGAGEFTSDLHILELDSMSWRSISQNGEVPAPRGWAAMAALDSDQFVLFGGLNVANERLDDTWVLSLAQ